MRRLRFKKCEMISEGGLYMLFLFQILPGDLDFFSRIHDHLEGHGVMNLESLNTERFQNDSLGDSETFLIPHSFHWAYPQSFPGLHVFLWETCRCTQYFPRETCRCRQVVSL